MKKKVEVTFEGAVYNVHVYIGGHEVSLKHIPSDKWEGSVEIDTDIVGDEIELKLNFTAPSFTDWALSIKLDGKEVFKDSGKTETASFSFSGSIKLAQQS